jgi:hypothetical protein
LGLENEITAVIVHDKDVGRWGQWKKVVSDECIATFMSPLYLPVALTASLKVLPVPDIPIVGHFAQACRAEFARTRGLKRRPYPTPPAIANSYEIATIEYQRSDSVVTMGSPLGEGVG